jgi:hypothetical protein
MIMRATKQPLPTTNPIPFADLKCPYCSSNGNTYVFIIQEERYKSYNQACEDCIPFHYILANWYYDLAIQDRPRIKYYILQRNFVVARRKNTFKFNTIGKDQKMCGLVWKCEPLRVANNKIQELERKYEFLEEKYTCICEEFDIVSRKNAQLSRDFKGISKNHAELLQQYQDLRKDYWKAKRELEFPDPGKAKTIETLQKENKELRKSIFEQAKVIRNLRHEAAHVAISNIFTTETEDEKRDRLESERRDTLDSIQFEMLDKVIKDIEKARDLE